MEYLQRVEYDMLYTNLTILFFYQNTKSQKNLKKNLLFLKY